MKRLGWRPDTPDCRDYQFVPRKTSARLPRSIDLRPRFFKPWNQKSLGACTAFAAGAACMYLDLYDDDIDVVTPSWLFLYYNARRIEGTADSDDGAEIRNMVKGLVKHGYPPGELWPYRVRSFREKPPALAYRRALGERVTTYERVDRNLNHFRRLLADGFPIIIGISVYDSIESGKRGRIPLPSKSDSMDGGHAILVVGYDDSRRQLIIRNSWGTSWGDGGYGYLPYAYIENPNLSDDFWVLKRQGRRK